MDKFITLLYKKYQNAILEDWGAYCSDDYKKYAAYVKKQFKASAESRGFTLKRFSVNHYDFSGFFEKNGKFIYFSSNQQRYEQPLDLTTTGAMNGILYRTAEHDRDFRGGSNNFTSIVDLLDDVERMFANIAA